MDGLEDYTVDERGDVGSWVRIACVKGLGDMTLLLLKAKLEDPWRWLPVEEYVQMWAALLKQGAERLDNVRAEVGKLIVKLLNAVDTTSSEDDCDSGWIPEGFDLMKRLFITE